MSGLLFARVPMPFARLLVYRLLNPSNIPREVIP
jgi:hypothetical protein